jgi:hypothetical protein
MNLCKSINFIYNNNIDISLDNESNDDSTY